MKKGIVGLLLLGVVLHLATSGCSWVGRTAGKAQAKLERKTNDIEEGYHQGYDNEKRRESEGRPDGPTTLPVRTSE